MSTSNDTHDAVHTIELAPVIGDTGSHHSETVAKSNDHAIDGNREREQSLQDGDEIASDEKPGDGRSIVGEETKSTSCEEIQDEAPNSSPSPPLSLQQTRSGVDADRREKQSSEQKGSNAMLNLPPPLPFDLKVSNLWVGVPHSGPSRYVRAACRSASGADV
jgi:hypothetical protein